MKSCLVVDDSAVIRKVARRILDGLDLAVTEAEDAAQATAAFERDLPDVAIIDAVMGDTDGCELVRALRRMPDGGRPRIVVATVEADVATIARIRHAGADTYLMKPFTAQLLRETLESVGLFEEPIETVAA